MKQKTEIEIEDKRTTKDLQSLAKMVLPLAKKMLGKKGFIEVDIITNWPKIVGNDLAQYSFPQSISFRRDEKNNGILHLMVPSGAFALEIKHRETRIISQINTYFGYNAVCSLKIIQNNEFSLDDEKPKKNNSSQKRLVTKNEENYIETQVNDVKNPKLKEILIKLGQSIYSNNNVEK